MQLTPEELAKAKELMKSWWLANYNEPTVIGATEHSVHGKGKIEKWRVKFRKAQAQQEQKVLEQVLRARTKDASNWERRLSISFASWKIWVLSIYPKATFKGPNAWVVKRNGERRHVGQYDSDVNAGEVRL